MRLQDASETYCFVACGDQGDTLSIIVNPVGLGGTNGSRCAGGLSNIATIVVELGASVEVVDQVKELAQTMAQADTEDLQ